MVILYTHNAKVLNLLNCEIFKFLFALQALDSRSAERKQNDKIAPGSPLYSAPRRHINPSATGGHILEEIGVSLCCGLWEFNGICGRVPFSVN